MFGAGGTSHNLAEADSEDIFWIYEALIAAWRFDIPGFAFVFGIGALGVRLYEPTERSR